MCYLSWFYCSVSAYVCVCVWCVCVWCVCGVSEWCVCVLCVCEWCVCFVWMCVSGVCVLCV